jgi:hypothetical protein
VQITARLEEATLRQVLGQLLPVTIKLDEAEGLDGRWVKINRADTVNFVLGAGVRLSTSGELRWVVAGVPLSLTIAALTLLLRPAITGEGAEGRLVFHPTLESADLSSLPALLDRGIVGLVNRALEGRGDRLAWAFGKTLSRQFDLPDTLVPLEAARIDVSSAKIAILDEALELTVALQMGVSRR